MSTPAQTANAFSTPGNEVGTLNGFFKETYADKLQELIPDGVKLLTKIKFVAKDKQGGNLFHQPVILGMEHGITFANSTDDAFNLNAPVAGVIKDAEVRGNPAVLRSVLGMSAASRASGSKNAFEDATKFLIANMLRSMAKKLEIEILYGQMGYATVASISSTTLTITTAEWAPGIWAGAKNMPLELRDTTGATSRGTATVTSVDMSARTVTLDTALVGVVAGDVVWHKGAFGKEFPGIHKILTATGVLFNIDTTEFDLFKGNSYDAGSAALSFTKMNLATARAVEKGLDSSLYALVNPRAWAGMMNDQAALRRYDSSYEVSKAETGSKAIVFHSQNGDIEIEPSIYVKEGYAYLLCVDEWMRVGSSDITFKMPGTDQDKYFRQMESAAGYEIRAFTDQAVFCSAPGRNVIIINIINPT